MKGSERVASSILRGCEEWAALATALEGLASTEVPAESQLGRDNAAAAAGDGSKAIRSYVTNRAGNAARYLREMHSIVLDKEPGKLSLNYTALYPLLRGVLEDAAAIVWLVSPSDEQERMMRILRTLRSDVIFLLDNHLLLVSTAESAQALPPGLALAVEAHMARERVNVTDDYGEVAKSFGLELKQVELRPQNGQIVKEAFGVNSQPYAMWKLLSDLSHFSYSMNKHLDAREPMFDTPLVNVVFSVFISEVNNSLRAACDALTLAMKEKVA